MNSVTVDNAMSSPDDILSPDERYTLATTLMALDEIAESLYNLDGDTSTSDVEKAVELLDKRRKILARLLRQTADVNPPLRQEART